MNKENIFSEKWENCGISNHSSESIWSAREELVLENPVDALKYIVNLQRQLDLSLGASRNPNDIKHIKELEEENLNLRNALSDIVNALEIDGRFPNTVRCIKDGLAKNSVSFE
jgi:hypothetical protein